MKKAYLGVDIGSISTKGVIIDEDNNIIASKYLYTEADPINAVKRLIKALKKDFDFVIIDCPAGIEHGFKNAIAGADKAVVVTTPEVSAVRDADRIIGLLEAAGLENPKLIINRIRTRMVQAGDMMSVDDMLEILAVDLLGIVPDDDSIVTSTNRGEPAVLDQSSKAGQAYRNITRRLCGEEVALMSLEEKEGFLAKIKSLFGSK